MFVICRLQIACGTSLMQVIHGTDNLPHLKWPVATLGTFDGIHLGHRKILNEITSWAHGKGGQAVVLTFSTHPRTITTGVASEFITSLNHRLLLMERLGVDIAIVLDFDRKLAEMPAEEFVAKYFCTLIKARGIVVGFDNRFGKDGTGNAALLRKMGAENGFEVREISPVQVDGETVSSTAIRNAICEGRLARAAAMLGRPVSLLGTVVGGEGRGRQLGFPTANLDLHHEARPPAGLYAGYASVGARTYKALVSIGSQPTFHAPDAPVVVEVHLHDYSGNLYGRDLEVVFVKKLRDQREFGSAEELIAAMREDIKRLAEIDTG